MPDLAELDPDAIRTAITRLEALDPIADELEAFNATRAVKQAELKAVKDELAAVAAERDKARADYAAARAELVVIQGALTAAYRERDEVERQLKQKGNVR
jgi:septal ring factor EnvC (AmiA/AmiB activator)